MFSDDRIVTINGVAVSLFVYFMTSVEIQKDINEVSRRFRLYHKLAKVVQSADKIFELLCLKNFVDS
jgi:hypothetical protein